MTKDDSNNFIKHVLRLELSGGWRYAGTCLECGEFFLTLLDVRSNKRVIVRRDQILRLEVCV